jgi:hypothetical protein
MKRLPIIAFVAGALLVASAHAEQALRADTRLKAADLSPPLTQMARTAAARTGAVTHTQLTRHLVTPQMKRGAPASLLRGAAPASSLQTAAAATSTTTTVLINQDGVPAEGLIAPPDPNGAVGETQYVQWVNIRLAIYNKSTGAVELGPIPGSALFAGMGTSPGAQACANGDNSDPIVQYDKLAKRWILTVIAWDPANFYTGPFYQCIAVSTTPDATGSYYRYAWDIRDTEGNPVIPDYPKVGVWPDAIYFSWVLFSTPLENYGGPRVCGVDRAVLLAGGSPAARCNDFGTAYGPILPSDLDGTTPPPSGSPNYLASLDFGLDGTGDHLFLWRFSFASATVSSAITIPVAPFTIACPTSGGGACVQQPAPGDPLDSLGDRLMYRLAYRNFGDREALVANHSVQQPGAPADGPLGVRWYELRNLRTSPGVYQQGTWAPDAKSRWMGSIAMDKTGNIALGYSISGPATYPGVRYTGRLRSEPLGRLEPETVLVNGSGVQQDTGNRWGDYSAMTIDPAGDCKFWYTQEYIAVTGIATWRTRIADFRFKNCQ